MYEDELKHPLDEVCIMCGERETMDNRDICSTCGSKAERLGREAEMLLSEEPEKPDWV